GVLSAVFTVLRLLQTMALLSAIGLTSGIVSLVVGEKTAAPSAIVGTLVVACLAMSYIITSSILYWKHLLPLLIATAADAAFSIAFLVASCLLGKPTGRLSCKAFPNQGNTSAFISSLFTSSSSSSSSSIVVSPSKSACHLMKATWGLAIASTLLFFASAAAAVFLWNNLKRCRRDANQGPRKAIDCE
ncbi:hypothetical protein BBK36DRAFT_1105297, partial [Trichoderma citrinoviride]